MKPKNLKTKIFLDGGDPEETKMLIGQLGFLDGQTTNPTLIAKNPEARERLEKGDKFSSTEIYAFYRGVVQEIAGLLPDGSVSIEVYADASTPAEQLLNQGKEMFGWIPNAHVKFPTTPGGLKAAEEMVKGGMRVNMTLIFSQGQAAAVYAATGGAKKGDVFLSPFIGRLDDRGENGMSLIGNIIKMYGSSDGHVEVLTASVRSFDHMMEALRLETDIITAPYGILKEWAEKGLPMPGSDFRYDAKGLKEIPYKEIDPGKKWDAYDIRHDLTDKGIERFSADWNSLIK